MSTSAKIHLNCTHCNRKYLSQEKLSKHIRENHSGESTPPAKIKAEITPKPEIPSKPDRLAKIKAEIIPKPEIPSKPDRLAKTRYDFQAENPKRKKEIVGCPVPKCPKKYQSEKKLIQHVAEVHPYETRKSNFLQFTLEETGKIWRLVLDYFSEMEKIRDGMLDGSYTGEVSAKNLLPQLYGREISQEDLSRITTAQQSFVRNFFRLDLSACDWKRVMKDFDLFFNMGLPYFDSNFCPTLLIDFFWHSLMQNPDLYRKICFRRLEEIIPHCQEERSEEEESKRYDYFTKVFLYKFSRLPYTPDREAERGSTNPDREAERGSKTLSPDCQNQVGENLRAFVKVLLEEQARLEEEALLKRKDFALQSAAKK